MDQSLKARGCSELGIRIVNLLRDGIGAEMASDLYGFGSGIKPDSTRDIVDSSSTRDSLDWVSFDSISTRVSRQWTWYRTQSDIGGISDCQTRIDQVHADIPTGNDEIDVCNGQKYVVEIKKHVPVTL